MRAFGIFLMVMGVLLLGVGALGLPRLVSPERYLTPVYRAMPQGHPTRLAALGAVKREGFAQLFLAGTAGLILLGLGAVGLEVSRVREALESR